MKTLISVLVGLLFSASALAQQKLNMNCMNEELMTVIAAYSKAANQKFVIDPNVRGKVTILLPDLVTIEEAFNHLSTALAINGYAISKQGDTMVIRSARNVQRDLIEVSTNRPTPKPERMYTWIFKPKYLSVDSISRELRMLISKDGELTVNSRTNQLIIADFTSNLNRVIDLLTELDKPVDLSTSKIVEAALKEREKFRHQELMRPSMPPPPVTPPKGE
jgi:type II secretory pathway component GspD/PulD (secretin)